MPPRLPYYVIETGDTPESARPFYTVINMAGNADFAALKKAEQTKTLPPLAPNVRVHRNSAEIHSTADMLIETYTDEPGGPERFKFRDECIVAQADERGRIFIDKEKTDLARRILREVRVLNPKAKLDPSGLMLPEEQPEELMKPRNLGGRPRRNP